MENDKGELVDLYVFTNFRYALTIAALEGLENGF